MLSQINKHKAYLQDLSESGVKAKRRKHEEANKEEPIRKSLPEFKEVRKKFVIIDYDCDEKE